jgi:preprotein translocase subunit SecB
MPNNENESDEVSSTAEQATVKFESKKIYLKDASFEAPSAPAIFTKKDVIPAIDIQATITYRLIEENTGLYDVNLKVTVTARHDNNTLYLAEIEQAGVFQIQHPDADTRLAVCEVTCPTILLPFAREQLNNMITKGGFSAFLLAPINFETLFQSKRAKEKEQANLADETGKPN